MGHSKTYKLFVFSFLLLFSFFHVGYATVEYICSMGMEMEELRCTNCHPEHEQFSGKATIVSNDITGCCNVVVAKTEIIDTYVVNHSDIHSFIEHALYFDSLVLSPEETHIVHYFDNTTPDLPLFNLHGISTSIQYSSFLR